MRKAHVVGLGAVLWAVLAALPAQAVVLRYAPEVGRTTKYKANVKGDMSMSTAGLLEGSAVKISGTMSVTQKAVAKQQNGTKVETRITGGTVKSSTDGDESSEPVPTGQVVTVLDERGRLVEVVSSDSGGEGAQSGFPGLQDWGTLPGFSSLPEAEVKPGDVWTDEIKIPASGTMPEMDLQVRSRLAELTTYQGHKVAKISTSFSGPVSGDLAELSQGSPQQVQGTMSGDVQGRFLCYYDYEKSAYVHSEGRFTMTVDTAVAGEQGSVPAMHMKLRMTMDMSLAK